MERALRFASSRLSKHEVIGKADAYYCVRRGEADSPRPPPYLRVLSLPGVSASPGEPSPRRRLLLLARQTRGKPLPCRVVFSGLVLEYVRVNVSFVRSLSIVFIFCYRSLLSRRQRVECSMCWSPLQCCPPAFSRCRRLDEVGQWGGGSLTREEMW